MNTTEDIRAQFSALASHLGRQQHAILEYWRIAIEKGQDLTIASTLTPAQFNDHIPGVLDAFARELVAWPDEEVAQTRLHVQEQITQHGLLRWQQGYPLSELIREWGHLQVGVMLELEIYALAHPGLEPSVMTTARLKWLHLCCDGITEITTQYWQLNKSESGARLHDLEQALFASRELDRARAAAWREAAHDMRGSMNVVMIATSMLDRMDVPDPMRLEFSGVLQRGVSSLQEMLSDLMSLARLDAGLEERKITPFDAGMRLADFCTTSLPLAQARGLFLKMDGPGSLPVQGDGVKIQRILQNLVLNALKYTQRGGVTVNWGTPDDSDAKRWMFSVQDTGPGLDASPDTSAARRLHQATLMADAADDDDRHAMVAATNGNAPTVPAQPATLLLQQQPGEGVGLAIVKRLCELLDASLELETMPGVGSTFRVTLPLRYDDGVKAGEHSVLRSSSRSAGELTPLGGPAS